MNRRSFTAAEDQIMIEYYPVSRKEEMLELLPGRSISQVYHRANTLKLKKTPETLSKILNETALAKLEESGRKYRFPKGHIPANKGIKQVDYMSAEAIERTKKTRFKKGNLPANTKHDGAITLRYPHKNRGATDLTDNYVAGMITGHDKELSKYLLEHRPDIIRAARAYYKLNRAIKNGQQSK
jgi:predicted MPP superfamily phosphohydrolase